MSATSKTQSDAKVFIDRCKAWGWSIHVNSESVITIHKSFTPGDNAAYVDADCEGGTLLNLAPLRGGNVWGSTSDGVGGYVALKNGSYVLNKSGTAKRFMAAVAKLV